MYFRGIKNIDATIEWALQNGLKTATEFVLTGGSAGGLSTFLHADRVAARVEAEAPNCKKIRAAPVGGSDAEVSWSCNSSRSRSIRRFV